MPERLMGAGYLLIAGWVLAGGAVPAFSQTTAQPAATASGEEVSLLKKQVAAQQKMLEQMQATLAEMKTRFGLRPETACTSPRRFPRCRANTRRRASLGRARRVATSST